MELQGNGLYGEWKCDTAFAMPCDRCGKSVAGGSWRFMLDDKKGPKRGPKHHHKRNSYMCEPCANSEGYEMSRYAFRRGK
jgi:hypothetical protein